MTRLRPPTGETVWRVAWLGGTLNKDDRLYGSGEWCIDFDTEAEALEFAAGHPHRLVYPVIVETCEVGWSHVDPAPALSLQEQGERAVSRLAGMAALARFTRTGAA